MKTPFRCPKEKDNFTLNHLRSDDISKDCCVLNTGFFFLILSVWAHVCQCVWHWKGELFVEDNLRVNLQQFSAGNPRMDMVDGYGWRCQRSAQSSQKHCLEPNNGLLIYFRTAQPESILFIFVAVNLVNPLTYSYSC